MLCAQTRTVSLVSWKLAEKQFCRHLHFIERVTELGERAWARSPSCSVGGTGGPYSPLLETRTNIGLLLSSENGLEVGPQQGLILT